MTILLVSFGSVFGGGGQQLQADVPQSRVTFQNDNGTVTATLDAGQNVNAAYFEIVGARQEHGARRERHRRSPVSGKTITRADPSRTAIFGSGTIKVGDCATVAKHVGDGEELRIVSIDPDSDQRTVLAKCTG